MKVLAGLVLFPLFHYTATATCEADCKVLTIPGEGFLKFLVEDPAAGFTVMQRLTELMPAAYAPAGKHC